MIALQFDLDAAGVMDTGYHVAEACLVLHPRLLRILDTFDASLSFVLDSRKALSCEVKKADAVGCGLCGRAGGLFSGIARSRRRERKGEGKGERGKERGEELIELPFRFD